MRHVEKIVHVIIFAVTVHVWHVVTSDRLLDAYADVAIDKVATVGLHLVNFSGE